MSEIKINLTNSHLYYEGAWYEIKEIARTNKELTINLEKLEKYE